MMKRKISFLIAATLAAALLAGCGGSSSSSEPASSAASSAPASSAVSSEAASEAASSEEAQPAAAEPGDTEQDRIFSALSEVNPISNPFEIAAMNIEYDFMLAQEDVVSYKGVKSNDNGDAGMVLVIQAAEGRGQAICEALESYRQAQVAYYGNYAEFAQAQTNVSDAVIAGKGDYVVMVIASNECSDPAALEGAVDEVLAG